MKNTWKYSTLSSDEKLKRIEDGDGDLYNTETEGINKYISLLKEAGADYSEAVSYKNKLDNAKKAYDRESAVLPKYAGGKNRKLTESAYENIVNKMKVYKERIKELEEERETVNGYLSEWLANNGYSRDGNMAKKTIDSKNKELDNREKELKENHEKSVKTTKRILGLESYRRF